MYEKGVRNSGSILRIGDAPGRICGHCRGGGGSAAGKWLLARESRVAAVDPDGDGGYLCGSFLGTAFAGGRDIHRRHRRASRRGKTICRDQALQ